MKNYNLKNSARNYFAMNKKQIKILPEIILQAIILLISYDSIATAIRWWVVQNNFPESFIVYYNAGNGEFLENWLYKNELAFTFSFLNNWDIATAFFYWCYLQTICFMVLCHKVIKFRYGWLLVLINLFSFSSILKGGNINIIFALLSCYSVGSLICVVYKPHLVIYPLLFYFKKTRLTAYMGRLWLIIAAVIFLFAFPSQRVLDYGMNQARVFSRWENIIFIMPLFYIYHSKKKLDNDSQKI